MTTQVPHAVYLAIAAKDLLLTGWQAPISRSTMDIDLLGRTDNAVEVIATVMRELSQVAVADDGIVFDPASFAGGAIREDADYAGVRTTFVGRVDTRSR